MHVGHRTKFSPSNRSSISAPSSKDMVEYIARMDGVVHAETESRHPSFLHRHHEGKETSGSPKQSPSSLHASSPTSFRQDRGTFAHAQHCSNWVEHVERQSMRVLTFCSPWMNSTRLHLMIPLMIS